MRTCPAASLARSRAMCTSMVLDPSASASLSQTPMAIDRRSTTAGDRRISISRMPSSVPVSAGRCAPIRTSLAAGSNTHVTHDQLGRLGHPGPPLQRPDPGQQLGEIKRLDQVVVGALVQSGDPVRRACPGRSA